MGVEEVVGVGVGVEQRLTEPQESLVVRELVLAVVVEAVVGVVGVEEEAGVESHNTADRIQEELRPVAEEAEGAVVGVAEEVAVELHNTEDQILGQMPVRELRGRRRGRSTYR